MTKFSPDYFRYFVPSPEAQLWGVEITACGWSAIPAGVRYPAPGHPEDHHFDWERGRVLEALQVVLVSRGRGELEIGRGKRIAIGPGTAFALAPGRWHRYRPDRETGWVESWIEVRGSLVDGLLRRGEFDGERAIRRGGAMSHLETSVEAVHKLARAAEPGFSPIIAAGAFEVLARWAESPADPRAEPPLQRAVQAAERELTARYEENLSIEELAARLGVGYSHFRRAFKEHTGFAPWQYVIHLRLTRARRLLTGTGMTLEAIAQQLGFSSAFHLSSAFKKAYGESPDPWRRRMWEEG